MLEANRLRYLKTQQENLLKRMQKEKESGANRMLRWVREKTDAVLMVIVIADGSGQRVPLVAHE